MYSKYDSAFTVGLTKINAEVGMVDLTCFIIRTGALILPQNALSHQLVFSGLATLLHIDPEGNNCLTHYFPEHIVSNPARVRMTDDVRFANGLKQFLMRMNVGTFKNTGAAGELVTKMLILRGFDRSLLKRRNDANIPQATNQQDYPSLNDSRVVEFNYFGVKFVCPKLGFTTVREFLTSCTNLSVDQLKEFKVDDDLLNGFVSLNQFNQVESNVVIDQLFLLSGFTRSTAFSLWHLAPGADLIIPVMRTSGAMGCIAVQAKNINEKFPHNVSGFNDKLSANFMKYLNFSQCGDFPAVHAEARIICILVQLGAGNASEELFQFNKLSKSKYSVLWPVCV